MGSSGGMVFASGPIYGLWVVALFFSLCTASETCSKRLPCCSRDLPSRERVYPPRLLSGRRMTLRLQCVTCCFFPTGTTSDESALSRHMAASGPALIFQKFSCFFFVFFSNSHNWPRSYWSATLTCASASMLSGCTDEHNLTAWKLPACPEAATEPSPDRHEAP